MTDATADVTAGRIEANGRRAARRREVVGAVRDVRERISSPTGNRPAFDHEILLGYARNRMSSLAAFVLLIATIAATVSVWVPVRILAAWLVAVTLPLALIALICKRFIALPGDKINLTFWRRQFVVSEMVFGVGLAGLFFLPSSNHEQASIFAFGALLITLAVSAMVASNLPRAVIFGTMPIALAGAAHFALSRDIIGYIMAGFALIAEIFFLALAYRLHRTALVMLETRAEKDELFVELEHAKAISDESRRRAEEANLAKSKFLATMSHELRTPLNAILGFSEIMKGEVFGPMGNANYTEYAGDIYNSGKHLLNLINEILDLSRIEAGKYTLNEEAVPLPDVVDDCHHLMKLKAKTKGITIHEQYERALPKIWADERAVRQIVLNLLSNAVKFTPQGGEIWLKMGWTAGGGQYVCVRDNGPGIPENEIPIVLEAFGQGSLAAKTAEQGTGLGLPIVQALVQMHGGTFDLRSKLREGTEVTVTFPPSRVMEVMPAIKDRAPGEVDREEIRRRLRKTAA